MNDNVNRNWPSGQSAAEAGLLTAARSNQIEAVQGESNQLKPKQRTTGSGTFTAPGPIKRIRRSARPYDPVAAINRLFGWHQHPRNGKVARLPETMRDQINGMLDDGFPYRAILKKLRESSAEALAHSLSEMNISNWVHGGYQDWRRQRLEEQVISDAVRTRERRPPAPSSNAQLASPSPAPIRTFPRRSAPIKG